MCRRAAFVLIPFLAVTFLVQSVAAGRLWCKADPVVSLDSRLVGITVAIPVDYLLMVNGPVEIDVKTPGSVDRQVVINDTGFNGHGTVITFSDGSGTVKENVFAIDVRVRIPVDTSQLADDESVPVEVTVMPDNDDPVTGTGTREMTKVTLEITGS